MRQRIGLVLAGLEALLVERPGQWTRRVELPRRRRRASRLLLWPPLAAASVALGWALALASH